LKATDVVEHVGLSPPKDNILKFGGALQCKLGIVGDYLHFKTFTLEHPIGHPNGRYLKTNKTKTHQNNGAHTPYIEGDMNKNA
jgi:hypothetical protein